MAPAGVPLPWFYFCVVFRCPEEERLRLHRQWSPAQKELLRCVLVVFHYEREGIEHARYCLLCNARLGLGRTRNPQYTHSIVDPFSVPLFFFVAIIFTSTETVRKNLHLFHLVAAAPNPFVSQILCFEIVSIILYYLSIDHLSSSFFIAVRDTTRRSRRQRE